MNLKREFNRLSDYFGSGVEKMHSMADDIGESVRSGSKHARSGLHHSKESLVTAQDAVSQSMRDHPMIYIGAALMLAGVILAAMMYSSEQRTLRYQRW